MKLRCRSCKNTFDATVGEAQAEVPCPECGEMVSAAAPRSATSSQRAAGRRASAGKRSGKTEAGANRRRTARGKSQPRRRNRIRPEDAAVVDGDSEPADDYDEFMQSYGSSADINLMSGAPSSQDRATTKRGGKRHVGDLTKTWQGLLVQGCALSAVILVLGLLLVLWTFGYVETSSLRLGWVVLGLGVATMLAGEGLCLTIPPDSGARSIGIAALVSAGLVVGGLAGVRFMTFGSAGTRLLAEMVVLFFIVARLGLVSLFLSRLAGYIQSPTYETRSVFAMVGMPLAAVATFGYMRFAPVIPADADSSEKLILTGVQWWIVMTAVAVAVMYLSILLGMGLTIRRR